MWVWVWATAAVPSICVPSGRGTHLTYHAASLSGECVRTALSSCTGPPCGRSHAGAEAYMETLGVIIPQCIWTV